MPRVYPRTSVDTSALALQASVDTVEATLATIQGLVDDLEGRLTAARALQLDDVADRPAAATYFAVSTAIAAAVVLDSGQLAAGEYEIEASGTFGNNTSGSAGAGQCDLEHRDAANTGNIKTVRLTAGASGDAVVGNGHIRWPRVTVALNERFRLNLQVAAQAYAGWSLFVRPV